ncbi:MAG: SAM-dependent methyltransferase [Nitrospirota bacterium]
MKVEETLTDNNTHGKLWFVGGGPGDPALMTLRGMEVLKSASLVFAPGHYRETYAAALEGKEHYDPFDFHHKDLTEKIDSALNEGKDVVFLVPGDLAIFSPVQSIISRFPDAEVIPGVSALNAASAALKRTFDLPGISHSTIATSPKTINNSPDTIGELSRHQATLVLFMNNKKPDALAAELSEGYPPDTPVAIVSRISLPGQGIINTTVGGLSRDVDPEWFADEDAFKIVVVGRALTASEDPSWWDRRKDIRDERLKKKNAPE